MVVSERWMQTTLEVHFIENKQTFECLRPWSLLAQSASDIIVESLFFWLFYIKVASVYLTSLETAVYP